VAKKSLERSQEKSSDRPFLKTILSLFILFHLSVVLLIPNPHSYLNQQLKWLFTPYANVLGIHVNWQFFSPDPGQAIFFEIEADIGQDKNTTHYFPAIKNTTFWRQTQNRRIAVKNIIGKQPYLLSSILIPAISRQNPGYTNIDISLVTVKFPSLQEVQDGLAINDLHTNRKYELLTSNLCQTTEQIDENEPSDDQDS